MTETQMTDATTTIHTEQVEGATMGEPGEVVAPSHSVSDTTEADTSTADAIAVAAAAAAAASVPDEDTHIADHSSHVPTDVDTSAMIAEAGK